MEIISYKIFDGDSDFDWDNYVDAHPEGRYCHLKAYYKTIERTYSLKTYRIAFYDINNEVKGIFAGVLIRDFLGKKKIISMPYTDYGGILLTDTFVLPEKILIKSFNELLSITRAVSIKIHGKINWGGEVEKNLFGIIHDCNFAVLTLTPGEEITKRFDYSIRKNLQRAIENKLNCYNDISTGHIKKSFYPMYVNKMKKFGTPPHSIFFFTSLVEEMKERVKLFTVKNNDSIVSMLLGISTKNIMQISYIVSEKDLAKIRHDDFIHWKMIEWALENNHKIFDFGVARYEGQKKYKLKWGVSLKEYSHFIYPRKSSSNNNENFLKQSIVNKLWSKIVPQSVSTLIGPRIRKRLGR